MSTTSLYSQIYLIFPMTNFFYFMTGNKFFEKYIWQVTSAIIVLMSGHQFNPVFCLDATFLLFIYIMSILIVTIVWTISVTLYLFIHLVFIRPLITYMTYFLCFMMHYKYLKITFWHVNSAIIVLMSRHQSNPVSLSRYNFLLSIYIMSIYIL